MQVKVRSSKYGFGAMILLSGCSLFDPLDVDYQPESDSEVGVALDMPADLVTDAAVDVPSDAAKDGFNDVGPDLETVAVTCGEMRMDLPSGGTCASIPTLGECSIVEQGTCGVGGFCTFRFTGVGVVPACASLPANCDVIAIGQICSRRADERITVLGTCEPGSFCPALNQPALTANCERYCELESGLGCEPDDVCVWIGDATSDQSAARYGVCQAGACPN